MNHKISLRLNTYEFTVLIALLESEIETNEERYPNSTEVYKHILKQMEGGKSDS